MLTLPEEFLLLSHDEHSGHFIDFSQPITNIALVGAALMELAMLGRIDNDLEKLMLVDDAPTGEPPLDHVLAKLAADAGQERSVRHWIELLAPEGPKIRELALARLLDRGILREEEGRFLWVFQTRRYPLIDNKEQTEVKLRLARLLMSDDIPDMRDIAILNLAHSCGLLYEIFSASELERSEQRIRDVSRLDLIGQAMSATIEDLRAAIVAVMPR